MTQPFDDIRGKINDAITALSSAQNIMRQADLHESIASLESVKDQLRLHTMEKGWLWYMEHGEDAE